MRLFKNVRSLLLNSSGTKGQRIAFLIAHCPESLGKMPQMSKYPGQGGKFEFVISPLAWPALAWLALNSQHFCQRRSLPPAYKPLFSSFSISKGASFLDINLFKKLFEYTQYLVLSSLAPFRNSELAVVLAVV